VAARQQTDEHAVHNILLSYDDFSNFGSDTRELGSRELEGGIWLHPDYIISGRPLPPFTYER
jgi:hypothetical protein